MFFKEKVVAVIEVKNEWLGKHDGIVGIARRGPRKEEGHLNHGYHSNIT